jgi:carbamoyl-phosphate synthase small subunit
MSFCQIVFADGTVMHGQSLGAEGQAAGMLMPYTSMTDYQTILCDPATHDQLICMTYPLIGNVGQIDFTGSQPPIAAAGLILRESISDVDHWLSRQNLRDWLREQGTVAISGIDTREVIRHLREKGAINAVISTDADAAPEELAELAGKWQPSPMRLNSELAGYFPAENKEKHHVAILDLGLESSQVKSLTSRGCSVTVFPAASSADTILADSPEALLLSSGPEYNVTLAAASYMETISQLKDKIVLWGVDAGHLLLAQSFGLRLEELPLGHHGANYPVRDAALGRTYMTLQHHRLVVGKSQCENSADLHISHLNINDLSVEGLVYQDKHRSVQFIPDKANELHQTGYIWDELLAGLS